MSSKFAREKSVIHQRYSRLAKSLIKSRDRFAVKGHMTLFVTSLLSRQYIIDGVEVDSRIFQVNAVHKNTKILRRSDNCLQLAFLPRKLAINEFSPELQSRIRCKDLAFESKH